MTNMPWILPYGKGNLWLFPEKFSLFEPLFHAGYFFSSRQEWKSIAGSTRSDYFLTFSQMGGDKKLEALPFSLFLSRPDNEDCLFCSRLLFSPSTMEHGGTSIVVTSAEKSHFRSLSPLLNHSAWTQSTFEGRAFNFFYWHLNRKWEMMQLRPIFLCAFDEF